MPPRHAETDEYVEARPIGTAFLKMPVEADIRFGQHWPPYADPTAEEPDDLQHGHDWQRLGDVTSRAVAGLRRIAE